jgi:hypothetical protein
MALGPQIASQENLWAFCDWAARDGARLAENPRYGGVTAVHARGSWHYDGKAVDVNWGPAGSPAVERQHAVRAVVVARAFGLGVIYARDGVVGSAARHRGHLHADCGSTYNVGRGLVSFRTAPVITTYRLQCAVRAERDNRWGADTDSRLQAVRLASRLKGTQFPRGVAYTQRVLGVADNGAWDATSRAAHDDAVAAIQRALGLRPSGVWDAATDGAFATARTRFRR